MKSNRVLLFDLGGVLIENAMFPELKRLMATDASTDELVERWLANPLARRFETGACPADEFARAIVAEFGLPLSPGAFLEAFATWPQGFSPGAEPMLAALRARYRIACLSNSNVVHWSAALTAPFDAAFASHLMGCIKPDRNAFEHVLDALAVEPQRVHYFDDASSNVEAARRLGMNAHRTVGFEALQATLRELGLLEAR